VRTRLSLRARATMFGTTVFAVLLTVGSVLLVSTLESRLTEAADQLSRSRVEDLLTLARSGDLGRGSDRAGRRRGLWLLRGGRRVRRPGGRSRCRRSVGGLLGRGSRPRIGCRRRRWSGS
jgi:hypothetical protein